ncbi:unnamed protein product [Schistocephalus solidus]|uniref:Uncharacterized protein n=1 Tax=Schistocephalus solidus TaxID=70667 RepID=A0A183TFF0_SCHSO|nr:unnamed protein product [Schistocephalus solidus]
MQQQSDNTSASEPTTTTTTPTTDNNFINAPPPTIIHTILPPPLPAPITATSITCPIPTISVTTTDYLPTAISNTAAAPNTSDGDSSEPHLGDDEAVICPTIGIADRLGYQHVLSISPPDENIVQQMPAPRPRVHSRGLLPRRKAEEGVGQQETVFRTRAQKKEAEAMLWFNLDMWLDNCPGIAGGGQRQQNLSTVYHAPSVMASDANV